MTNMQDIVYTVGTIAFFAIMAAFIWACQKV